jgi:hypothetical protein
MSDNDAAARKQKRRVGVIQMDPNDVVLQGSAGTTSRKMSMMGCGPRARFDSSVVADYLPAGTLAPTSSPCFSDDDMMLLVPGPEDVYLTRGVPHSESGNSIGVGLGRVGFTMSYGFQSEELRVRLFLEF